MKRAYSGGRIKSGRRERGTITINKKRGFTLIELVIVVAIIAVLAAVLIPVASGYIEKTKSSACASNIRILTSYVKFSVTLGTYGDFNSAFAALYDSKKYYCPTGGRYYVSDGTIICTEHGAPSYYADTSGKYPVALDTMAVFSNLQAYLKTKNTGLPFGNVQDGGGRLLGYVLTCGNLEKTVTVDGVKKTVSAIMEDEYGVSAETIAKLESVYTGVKVFFNTEKEMLCTVYKEGNNWVFIYPNGNKYAVPNNAAKSTAQQISYAYDESALSAQAGG